ncbi:hypothetical protein A7K94_0220785, partial [Modestobacter sp. VKM Ac-2676]
GAELDRERGELLTAVGLTDADRVLRSTPGELSGGQRQRVCIAMALASRAGLLVADEPTTALDLVTQAQVVTVLREGGRDSALLFITHDIAVAASLCDRAVVLHEGTVVEDAPIPPAAGRPAARAERRAGAGRPRRRAPDPVGGRIVTTIGATTLTATGIARRYDLPPTAPVARAGLRRRAARGRPAGRPR